MNIKIGSYVLNGEFKDKKGAKETFLNHFPVVTEKDLDKQLDKLFKNANKPNNSTKQTATGDSSNAVLSERAVGKKQPGKD